MDMLRLFKVVIILLCSLSISGSLLAKSLPSKPQSAKLAVQSVTLTKEVLLEYRYVNGELKYIAVKNTGVPIDINLLGQHKVIGQNDSYIMTPPPGVKVIQMDLTPYSPREGSKMLDFEKTLGTRTYVLLLPEGGQQPAQGEQPKVVDERK